MFARPTTPVAPAGAERAARLRAFVRAAGCTAVAVGVLVLAGWGLDVAVLKSVVPGLASMAPATALGFVLSGCSLVGVSAGGAAPLAAGTAGLAGLLTLVDAATDLPVAPDRLLLGGSSTGKVMAPTTALCFILVAVAMTSGPRGRTRIAHGAASIVVLIAVVATIGYVFGASALYTISVSTSMALHSALTFIVLGAGLLVAWPHPGPAQLVLDRGITGRLTRRLLPAAVVVPVLAAWITERGRAAGFYTDAMESALVVVFSVVALGVLVLFTARRVLFADEARRRALDELARANEGLEEQVRVRTAELERSEEKYRAVVEKLPDAVSVFAAVRDADGEIVDFVWTYANAGAAAITGHSEEELVGHTLLEVLPDHGPSGMFDVYRDLVATGRPYEEPTLWYEDVWGDGERVRKAFDVRASKVHDGFVVVTRDVTDLRLHAEHLERLAEEERRLAELKNDFVGVVAHDLRSPLTVADGFATFLRDEWDAMDDGVRLEMLGKIQSSIQRMGGLANDVLEVVRLQSDGFTFELEVLDLEELVRTTATEVASAAGRTCTVTADAGLPRVLADRDRLWRVMTNLVSNACKFSPDDAPVEVHVGRSGANVCVTVTDHGVGIAPSDQARLFEKFSRVASKPGERRPQGTGLGLYICKAFVEGLGGTITVSSEPGRGSTFTFTVPAADAEASAA